MFNDVTVLKFVKRLDSWYYDNINTLWNSIKFSHFKTDA